MLLWICLGQDSLWLALSVVVLLPPAVMTYVMISISTLSVLDIQVKELILGCLLFLTEGIFEIFEILPCFHMHQ